MLKNIHRFHRRTRAHGSRFALAAELLGLLSPLSLKAGRQTLCQERPPAAPSVPPLARFTRWGRGLTLGGCRLAGTEGSGTEL